MSKPGAAAAEVEDEEKSDGTADEENPEGQDPGHQPGEGEDPDGEGKSGADGEDGGEHEDEPGEKEGEEAELTPEQQEIADLRAKIEAIEKGSKPKEEAAQPVVYTEEQKAKIEEKFGGMPFTQVEAVTGLVARAVNQVLSQLEGRFSKSDKSSIIADLAKTKEYADIGTYTQAIDKYLAKFAPTMHGNKDVIVDALFWAKGQGLKNAVRKAISSGEKNKRIAGAARPAAPAGGGGGKGGGFKFKLTPAEESAYASFGKHHFKTKEDYAKSLKRYRSAGK